MIGPHVNFRSSTQKDALRRQKYRCGSCGSRIWRIGKGSQDTHRFGESAEGHHVIPHKMGGDLSFENCVVLCKACHYSAHAGNFRTIAQYKFVKGLPLAQKIETVAKLYPYYE